MPFLLELMFKLFPLNGLEKNQPGEPRLVQMEKDYFQQ